MKRRLKKRYKYLMMLIMILSSIWICQAFQRPPNVDITQNPTIYENVDIVEENNFFTVNSKSSMSDLIHMCNDLNLDFMTINSFEDIYGINAIYALSVLILETGWLKSELWEMNYNPAGIKCGKHYCAYSSKYEGIESMFKLMNMYVINYELVYVADQRELWSESDDTEEILRIMQQFIGEMNYE